MSFYERLGRNVKAERHRSGLRQSDLADAANLDESTIAKIEQGRSNPTIGTLKAISNAIGCSLHDLIPETPSGK